MGFFSWECKGCGASIRNIYSGSPDWMIQAVCLTSNGSILIGEYDGYGKVDGLDFSDQDDSPELWHKVCWVGAGKPSYTGPSNWAADQGFFIFE